MEYVHPKIGESLVYIGGDEKKFVIGEEYKIIDINLDYVPNSRFNVNCGCMLYSVKEFADICWNSTKCTMSNKDFTSETFLKFFNRTITHYVLIKSKGYWDDVLVKHGFYLAISSPRIYTNGLFSGKIIKADSEKEKDIFAIFVPHGMCPHDKPLVCSNSIVKIHDEKELVGFFKKYNNSIQEFWNTVQSKTIT